MPSYQSAQPSEMEGATRGPARLLEEPIPQDLRTRSFHLDDSAAAIRDSEEGKGKLNKRSLDYALRSGLAGGLAGCAVGHTSTIASVFMLMRSHRPKLLSVPWIVSRSFSKPRILNSPSILAAGSEL